MALACPLHLQVSSNALQKRQPGYFGPFQSGFGWHRRRHAAAWWPPPRWATTRLGYHIMGHAQEFRKSAFTNKKIRTRHPGKLWRRKMNAKVIGTTCQRIKFRRNAIDICTIKPNPPKHMGSHHLVTTNVATTRQQRRASPQGHPIIIKNRKPSRVYQCEHERRTTQPT